MEIWHPVWNAITFSTFPPRATVPMSQAILPHAEALFAGAAHILCTLSWARQRSYGTVLRGTAWIVTSRHAAARQTSVREQGNRSAEERSPFKFITRYAKITVEHPVLLSCFVFVFLHGICELFSLPCVVIKAPCSPSQAPGRQEACSTLGVMFWNTISRDVNLIWTQKGTEALTLLFFTKENCYNSHISGQCLHSHSDWRRKMYRFLKLARLSFNPSSHRCLMKVPPMFILL